MTNDVFRDVIDMYIAIDQIKNIARYAKLVNISFIFRMERILRGIMRYRHTTRLDMVKEFQKVRDNPEPKAVFFTCMDSRMIPTRFT